MGGFFGNGYLNWRVGWRWVHGGRSLGKPLHSSFSKELVQGCVACEATGFSSWATPFANNIKIASDIVASQQC